MDKLHEIKRLGSTKRKLVVRPLPFMLVFLILGLVACFFLYRYIVWIYLGLLFSAVILFLFGIIDKKLLIGCIIALVISLEGLLYISLFNKNNYLESGYYSGSGNVASISNGTAVLEDVTIEGEKANGRLKLNKVDAKVGDVIVFAGNLKTFTFDTSYDIHNISKGIYYMVETDFYRFEYDNKQSFSTSVKMFVRDALMQTTDKDTVDYLMSVMFGQSEYLDSDIKNDFTLIGAAHIFAVSGLHIGVLFAFLHFVLKKCKVPSNAIPFITAAIAIFYAYLCDFTPSVIRACIMFSLAEILLVSGFCSDRVSVFCFSALVSLVAKPIWIGDVSFLLSYGAVVGIFLLFPVLKKPFQSLTRFRGLGEVIALNTSICISLIPLNGMIFKSFSFLSVAGSFFIIPITSAVYVSSIICLPLMLFPILMTPITFFSHLLVLISGGLASAFTQINSSISISFSPYGLPLWYTGLVILSDYVNLDWRRKGIMTIAFLGSAFLIGLAC